MTRTRTATARAAARAAAVRRVLSPAEGLPPKVDNSLRNAELNWQELQGIADRVRILKRIVTRLSQSLVLMQERARAHRHCSPDSSPPCLPQCLPPCLAHGASLLTEK